MTVELKLIKIGNSMGFILPKDVVQRMRIDLGDKVFLSEAPNGKFSIGGTDEDFVEAMAAADVVMRQDRDILAVLAR